jgi:hypothetical protein
MNRDIHVSGNKRSLDFGREQSFPPCARIDNVGFVALCSDNFGLDCYTRLRGSNRFLDQPRLRAGKLAAACP